MEYALYIHASFRAVSDAPDAPRPPTLKTARTRQRESQHGANGSARTAAAYPLYALRATPPPGPARPRSPDDAHAKTVVDRMPTSPQSCAVAHRTNNKVLEPAPCSYLDPHRTFDMHNAHLWHVAVGSSVQLQPCVLARIPAGLPAGVP